MKKYYKSPLFFVRRIVTISLLAIFATSLFISCYKSPFKDQFTEIIYIQTNNYQKSMNAIIAYRNNGDGNLKSFLGGPFYTAGSGIANPRYVAGPNESDGEIRISNDKKFLLTVNSGSNTIAVFKIYPDGTLSHVTGSPFDSGGETPVSIDIWQQYVLVLNKSNNPQQPATQKPNITVFRMEGDGSLTPVSGGKYEMPAGSSPAHVIVSKTQPYVYVSNYLGYSLSPALRPVLSFTISNTGTLSLIDENPYFIPGQGGALGLCHNWKYNHLYVSTGGQRWFAYGIDGYTGKITFGEEQRADVGCSRFHMDNAGNNLYSANSIRNSVSGFPIPNATTIRGIGTLNLKKPGPLFNTVPGSFYSGSASSQAVSLAPSSDDKFLFVVSQHANPDLTIGNYNYLHVVQLTGDPWGNMHEDGDPIQLPVDNNIRPRGIAVLRLN